MRFTHNYLFVLSALQKSADDKTKEHKPAAKDDKHQHKDKPAKAPKGRLNPIVGAHPSST